MNPSAASPATVELVQGVNCEATPEGMSFGGQHAIDGIHIGLDPEKERLIVRTANGDGTVVMSRSLDEYTRDLRVESLGQWVTEHSALRMSSCGQSWQRWRVLDSALAKRSLSIGRT